jgi:hypothetical protein
MTAYATRVRDTALRGRDLSTRVTAFEAIPKSIAAGTLNYAAGLVYSLYECVRRDPLAQMKHDDGAACFHWITESIDASERAHREPLVVSHWLSNVYKNGALIRVAAIFERTMRAVVFAKCVSGLMGSPAYRTTQLRRLAIALSGFEWKSVHLQAALHAFNTDEKYRDFGTLRDSYDELQGRCTASDREGLEAIRKEVVRIKHWVGRQFSADGEKGLVRTIHIEDLLTATETLFAPNGLLPEMVEALEAWMELSP